MAATDHYQAIVSGSGQGGTPLCTALAQAGLRTALIERQHVGGTCVNEGCTPTKTMVASARVAYLARRATEYGVGAGNIHVDMEREEAHRLRQAEPRTEHEYDPDPLGVGPGPGPAPSPRPYDDVKSPDKITSGSKTSMLYGGGVYDLY